MLNWLLVKPTPSIHIGISEPRLWNAAPTYTLITNASLETSFLTMQDLKSLILPLHLKWQKRKFTSFVLKTKLNFWIKKYCFVYWRTFIKIYWTYFTHAGLRSTSRHDTPMFEDIGRYVKFWHLPVYRCCILGYKKILWYLLAPWLKL